ncbi:MAG: 8-oxoguanine deaminase [Chloroflexota bacterium]|nr:8-oxoguanine deaminase [Chloroflexota bacterium]
MTTLLIKRIHTLVTMDDSRRELHDAAVFVRDGVIEAVGALSDMPKDETGATQADEVIDLPHHVVMPGMVNTHHHMFQSLTRALAQDYELFDWLRHLYPLWKQIDGDAIYTSAKLAMAELILSGCTSSSDHLYLYPNGAKLDDEIRAAREIGIRFHAARGAMSVGESKGGLPPDDLVEDEAAILLDMRRVVETFHDKGRHAMLRVVIAPCSPFTVSQNLMRESATLAREYGVHLHTHLAENANDVAYSLEKFGMLPGDYARDLNWVGADVWHAHCVCLNEREIKLFGSTSTGVAHCPSSNMRLASGIAPIRKMLDSKVRVGLGVDGSASNDSGHLLSEARQAMLLQRVGGNPAALTAREALEIGTLGGAAVLGRADIGALKPGMAADMIAYRIDTAAFAGAQSDPVAALIFCHPGPVDWSIINGRIVVRAGHLETLDLPVLVEQHNKISLAMIRREYKGGGV